MHAQAKSRRKPKASEEGGFPLRRVLATIFRRKWIIATCVAIGLASGLVACIFVNPADVYEGRLPVLVRNPKRILSNVFPLDSQMSPAMRESLNLQAEIESWRSDWVIEQTVRDCALPEQERQILQEEKNTLRFRIMAWLQRAIDSILPTNGGSPNLTPEEEEARFFRIAAKHLRSELQIRPSQRATESRELNTYFLDLEYRNREKAKVKEVLQKVVEKYQEYKKRLMDQERAETKAQEILRESLEEDEKRLAKLEKELKAKYDEMGIYPGMNFNEVLQDRREELSQLRQRLSQLQVEYDGADIRLTSAERERVELRRRNEDVIQTRTSASSGSDQNGLLLGAFYSNLANLIVKLKTEDLMPSERESLQKRITGLRAEIKSLEGEMRKEVETQSIRSPEMQRLETEISTNQALKEHLGKAMEELKKEIETREKGLREVQFQVAQANKLFDKYNALLASVEDLRRRLKIQEIYRDARQDLQIVQAYDVRVPYLVPLHKFGRKVVLMLALVIGLCTGLGIALGLETMDTSVNTIDEVEEKLGLPVLASIQEYRRVRLVPRR